MNPARPSIGIVAVLSAWLAGSSTAVAEDLAYAEPYRALAVDYSENGRFGKNGLDLVQHGPVMGVTFNW